MSKQMPKNFDFAEAETRHLPMVGSKMDGLSLKSPMMMRKPFVISIPPPNVTGALAYGSCHVHQSGGLNDSL